MAKGVKKIKVTQGKYYPKMSVPGQRVTIVAEQDVYFQVEEWLPNTTAEDKKKPVIWMRQTNDRKIILFQSPSTTGYKFYMQKKFCGSYNFYVEASFSGQRDFKNNVGLYVKGWCEPKIITSKWSYQKDSPSIKNNKKAQHISYGHIVHLNLQTEGLNGNNLIIELWNQQYAKADKQICVYTDVQVIDGEVNLKIQNTYAWMAHVDNIQNLEEFYIKVKDQASGKYIKDNLGDDLHAIYLNVKNKVATTNTNVSQNQTPTKVYKPDVNSARIEPCKFEVIKFTENVVKDGKASNSTVTVFDNGKGIKRIKAPDERIHRTIYYKFDSTEIDKDGLEVLNNILKFLLEHKGSTINLSGYACVIGKENYNKGLSQRRADVVKKFFGSGGLDLSRIISLGKGEVDPTDDKMGRDNIKYKNEKDYENNRRVDISFTFHAHDAQTIIYETLAPSSDINLTVDVLQHVNKACFRDKDKHEKKIVVKSIEYKQPHEIGASSLAFPVNSQLAWGNIAPLNYIWPSFNVLEMGSSATVYSIFVNSCRWFSNKNNAVVQVKVFPDIKWTVEFKWNHDQPFAHTFGNKLHPYDIKEGRNKVIGAETDRGWSKNYGEMDQSFALSLKAEWNRITQGRSSAPQTMELGHKWDGKIRKTLGIFNKMKSMTERVSNSPLSKGRAKFTIESPKIAFAAQWYLERAPKTAIDLTTMVSIGVSAKPLVEAKIEVDLWKIFIKFGGDAVCPGAGSIISWILDKLGKEAGMHFIISISGGIYLDGKVTINTSYPKETSGEVKATGKIQVIAEFKAWAKGGIGYLAFEGEVKADVSTSVTGGIKVGADKKGIYAAPIAEFAGVKATFVAIGTVKLGIFKRTLSYEGESRLVMPDEIKFEKQYIGQ
ncbi:OmpA family protein [Chryseobacterium formosus]|uniref:OmpA family protein n=1 Tax=Chryseobacterium formosus TaxID=1537363 RepID=A0ABT3XLR6_9FLAO|nr:OmpA family protein [Chryseobacterium formosus]MCX8523068.1 OmpA family protein [Chryseobacterium formosus]